MSKSLWMMQIRYKAWAMLEKMKPELILLYRTKWETPPCARHMQAGKYFCALCQLLFHSNSIVSVDAMVTYCRNKTFSLGGKNSFYSRERTFTPDQILHRQEPQSVALHLNSFAHTNRHPVANMPAFPRTSDVINHDQAGPSGQSQHSTSRQVDAEVPQPNGNFQNDQSYAQTIAPPKPRRTLLMGSNIVEGVGSSMLCTSIEGIHYFPLVWLEV